MKQFIILDGLATEEEYLDAAFEITKDDDFALIEEAQYIPDAIKQIEGDELWIILQDCPLYLAWHIWSNGIKKDDVKINHFNIVYYTTKF